MIELALADPGRGIYAFGLCIPRILMALLIVPFASPSIMPAVVRAGIAVTLALILFPVTLDQFPAEGIQGMSLTAVVVKELVLGLFIGYLFGALFWAVEAIGQLIDTHRGATLAGALFLHNGQESSPLAAFLGQMFIVLFFIGGGAALFVASLYQSFVSWPIFTYYPSLDMASAKFFIDQLEMVVYLAVFLAGPAVIAMFLAEMGLAIINRFVPQLQVFFLALPIKSAIAVFVLTLYTFTLVQFLDDQVARLGARVSELFSLAL